MSLHDEARPILGWNSLLTVCSAVAQEALSRSGGSEMMERIAEASPRFKAKIAGVFYLLTILKQISKQQGFNSMFRRTHGTPYGSELLSD